MSTSDNPSELLHSEDSAMPTPSISMDGCSELPFEVSNGGLSLQSIGNSCDDSCIQQPLGAGAGASAGMEEEGECKVCLEKFKGDELFSLKCSKMHTFCKECIVKWYNTGVHTHCAIPNDKIYSCPICRQYGGFDVIGKICPSSYEAIQEKMKIYSSEYCLCKTNDAPYGNSMYCCKLSLSEMIRIAAEKPKNDPKVKGAMITFPSSSSSESGGINQVLLCQHHYNKYKDGEEIYHYIKQSFVKDPSHVVTVRGL